MQAADRTEAEASSLSVVEGDSSEQNVESLAERQERMQAENRLSGAIRRDDAGLMMRSISLSKHVFPMAHAEGPSMGVGGSGIVEGSDGASGAQVRVIAARKAAIGASKPPTLSS